MGSNYDDAVKTVLLLVSFLFTHVADLLPMGYCKGPMHIPQSSVFNVPSFLGWDPAWHSGSALL